MFSLFESILYKTRENYLAESLEYIRLLEATDDTFKKIKDLLDREPFTKVRDLFVTDDGKILALQNSGHIKDADEAGKGEILGGNLVYYEAGTTDFSKKCMPADEDMFNDFKDKLLDILDLRVKKDDNDYDLINKQYITDKYKVELEAAKAENKAKPKAEQRKAADITKELNAKRDAELNKAHISGKTDTSITLIVDGIKILIRMTGGGAKGIVYIPKINDFTASISSGVDMTNLTLIEEFMTAILFNFAEKGDDIKKLKEITHNSKEYYQKCYNDILGDNFVKGKLSTGIKSLFKDVNNGEDFKDKVQGFLGSWLDAIAIVVYCMYNKLDEEVTRVSGGKIHKSAKDLMICYHPKQLDVFDVNPYEDPTDIILLNKVYKRDGKTHTSLVTGEEVPNQLEYITRTDADRKNPFIHPGEDSIDPILQYKAIGVSLKKPKDEAAAHYIGTANLTRSTALKFGFDEDGNPIGDIEDIFVRTSGKSGYFEFKTSEKFRKEIGTGDIVSFCMRNKNEKSASGSISGEANGITGARGGGFGGENLINTLFKDGYKPEKGSTEYTYGPAFVRHLLTVYNDNRTVPEAKNLNEGALSIIDNKPLAIQIAKVLANSLKIPFINCSKGYEMNTVIPSYIKIA